MIVVASDQLKRCEDVQMLFDSHRDRTIFERVFTPTEIQKAHAGRCRGMEDGAGLGMKSFGTLAHEDWLIKVSLKHFCGFEQRA